MTPSGSNPDPSADHSEAAVARLRADLVRCREHELRLIAVNALLRDECDDLQERVAQLSVWLNRKAMSRPERSTGTGLSR